MEELVKGVDIRDFQIVTGVINEKYPLLDTSVDQRERFVEAGLQTLRELSEFEFYLDNLMYREERLNGIN